MDAPLNHPPLPRFVEASSETGTLHLRWTVMPPGAREAVVVISLRPLNEGLAEDFWRGGLDADLLRVPITVEDRQVQTTVPRGRPLLVAMLVEDADGVQLNAPDIVQGWNMERGATLLPEGPVEHGAPEGGQDIPLIFAGDEGPDLDQLVTRLRRSRESGHDAGGDAPIRGPGGGFGSRQRWTLTRLQWEPSVGTDLALVTRTSYMAAEEVQTWGSAPPSDALSLAPGTSSLIDGVTPLGTTRFFVVLQRDERGWAPLPLSPLPPPFVTEEPPASIGDVASAAARHARALIGRLRSEPVAGTDHPILIELLNASLTSLPEQTTDTRDLLREIQVLGEEGLL